MYRITKESMTIDGITMYNVILYSVILYSITRNSTSPIAQNITMYTMHCIQYRSVQFTHLRTIARIMAKGRNNMGHKNKKLGHCLVYIYIYIYIYIYCEIFGSPTGQIVKPNMADMENQSYVSFSPPARFYLTRKHERPRRGTGTDVT